MFAATHYLELGHACCTPLVAGLPHHRALCGNHRHHQHLGVQMNAAQKVIAVLGLLTIALTTCYAPYEFVGFDEIARMVNGDSYAQRSKYEVRGVIHAPMWAAPSNDDAERAYFWQDSTRHKFPEVQSVRLDSGRLALWWAGIVIVAAVAIIIAARTGGAEG